MKTFGATVGILIAILVGIGGLSYLSYLGFAFYAPKYEAVRRDTMIESRAYSEATTRRMYDLMRQHNAATTDAERAAIAAATRHEASGFDATRLPYDLQTFLNGIGR